MLNRIVLKLKDLCGRMRVKQGKDGGVRVYPKATADITFYVQKDGHKDGVKFGCQNY